MMIILILISILYIESIFGMDNLSETSSNTPEEIDWEEYTKQEIEVNDLRDDHKMIVYDPKNCFNENKFQKYKSEENCEVKNLIEDESQEINELKRKHKPRFREINSCEFCQRESLYHQKGKISGKSLCPACYSYESKYGHLIPRDERHKLRIHKDILVCTFCQKENTKYVRSQISGKSLCNACHRYERKYGYLIPPDERHLGKDRIKDHIHKNVLACEFCEKKSKQYIKGPCSGKSLCLKCYDYERNHGHLVALDKRYNREIHKNILECEFCHKENKKYLQSKVNGKSLCYACYKYESKHGYLISVDERNKRNIHKNKNILGCECCQKESKNYVQSKVNRKSLCHNCYQYEKKYGHLISADEKKPHEIHKNILVCEFCQKESNQYIKSTINDKSLCAACYRYESRYGFLVPSEERRKHWNILRCEFCQREKKIYITGKVSGKSLCNACYAYELLNGHERKINLIHKRKLLCENCQIEKTFVSKYKVSGKSLCQTCYSYEYRHGHKRKLNDHSNSQLNRLLDEELSESGNEDKVEKNSK